MRKIRFISICIILILLVNTHSISSADPINFIATELLGRPTDTSITINAVADTDLEIFFEYGSDSGKYLFQTDTAFFIAGGPIEITIDSLLPNTQYFYRMGYRQPGEAAFMHRDEHHFHTQRSDGNTFIFAVHGDPHLDEQSSPEIYRITLQNTLADNPDFLIDLGDNFMTDKIPVITPGKRINYPEIVNRHQLFRNYYDLTCHSVPLFLVLGNHEAEYGWALDGTNENMAVWATIARKIYYPNPTPDFFYTGCVTEEAMVGQRESYYAFTWGDALFVILDPYWYTTTKPGSSGDNWDWTLGREQYDWFKQTLETSNANFKFVFCHQLVGGKDTEGRGGGEYAHYFEMGGLNSDASWGFEENRPGWGKPLHQLMVENNVSVFFHGHDHFFARQNVDGVVYQLVPQPSHPNYKRAGQAEEYGYVTGDILPNSGHLRVTVSPENAIVDYVRTYLPADEDEIKGRKNGGVDFSYTLNSGNSSGTLNELEPELPENYELRQNYPNPFNPSTTISFSLPAANHVILKIHDLRGREVAVLLDGHLAAGTHTVQWQAENIPSGSYFYTLTAGNFEQTKKMTFLQ